MKRLLLILCLSLISLPTWAQKKPLIEGGIKGIRGEVPAVTEGLSEKVAQKIEAVERYSMLQVIQIHNLPGSPLVRVRLDNPFLVKQEVLPARMLYSDEVFNYITFEESARLYVPKVLAEKKPMWLRGMKLKNLPELKNILEKGLEKNRTSYDEGIFATSSLPMALSYAIPTKQVKQYVGQELISKPQACRFGDYWFPVVVSIPTVLIPRDESGHLLDARAFDRDIMADRISHVMTFLEINGHSDWYEAVLENNELILIKVPTEYIHGYFGEVDRGEDK